MKIRSLIWKTGCAVVIGVICSISPSLGQSVLPSSSSGTPTPPGPPIVFPSSPLGVLCDRLTNTICIPSTPTRSSIGDLDDKITKDVCAYAKCSPPSPVTFAFVQDAIQKSAQVTDSATALVYPNVFPDRIEILIVPSSGKEIRKVVPNVQSSEVTETV
ncbi:MAG: hypothetical protein ACK5CR_08810, partial [Pseudanabaena sp.]